MGVNNKYGETGVYMTKVGWFCLKYLNKNYGLNTKDRLTAVNNAREIKSQINDDLPIAKSEKLGMRNLDFLNEYIDHKKKLGEQREKTASNTILCIRFFLEWLDSNFGIHSTKVTTEHLLEYKKYLISVRKLSLASVNSYQNTIKGFYTYLIEQKYIHKSPFTKDLKIKNIPTKREQACTVEQRDEILSKLEPDDEVLGLVLYMGFFAGLRKGEIINCKPEHFELDDEGNFFRIHVENDDKFSIKDKKHKSIPVNKRLNTFLKNYGLRKPYMLAPHKTSWQGAYRFDFRRRFNTFMSDIGYKWVCVHTLRHTFVSILINNGTPFRAVSEWTGTDVSTLEKNYSKVFENQKWIESL